MKRALFKWVKRTVLLALAIALLAIAVVYVGSEIILRRSYDVALEGPLNLPADPVAIDDGIRLARMRGCYDGCHGSGVDGERFLDEPGLFGLMLGRVDAPDLSVAFRSYSDAELERLIRHGIRRDGRSSVIMPTMMLRHLADDDLAKIIAAIRAQPVGDGPVARLSLGPLPRAMLLTGAFQTAAEAVDGTHETLRHAPREGPDLGRYLAFTMCTECHGARLEGAAGEPGMPARPPLAVVAGYSAEQFETLLASGVNAAGRELDMMPGLAGRFAQLRPDERDALYAYLASGATAEPAP